MKKHQPLCSPADCLLLVSFEGSSTFSVWTKDSGEILVPAKTPEGKLNPYMQNTWSSMKNELIEIFRSSWGEITLGYNIYHIFNSIRQMNNTNKWPYLWIIISTAVRCVEFGLSWLCLCELNGLDLYLLQVPQRGSVLVLIFQLHGAVMELLSDPFNFPHHSV